jgi:hypothetical protein
MTQERSAAEAACLHIARRIQIDGSLAYLIGPFSETYELVTEAVAQTLGKSVSEYRAEIEPRINAAMAHRPLPRMAPAFDETDEDRPY